jgi:hypothetical protein
MDVLVQLFHGRPNLGTLYCVHCVLVIKHSVLLQGPHPLYKPTQGNIIPRSDSSCQKVRGYPSDTSKQCDYDILYADQSSSLAVLAMDSMQLVTEDGERETLDLVFGYDPTSQQLL